VIVPKPEMRPEFRMEYSCDGEETTNPVEQIARLECVVAILLEKNERLRRQLGEFFPANSAAFATTSRFRQSGAS
jgi:hypothetical protein